MLPFGHRQSLERARRVPQRVHWLTALGMFLTAIALSSSYVLADGTARSASTHTVSTASDTSGTSTHLSTPSLLPAAGSSSHASTAPVHPRISTTGRAPTAAATRPMAIVPTVFVLGYVRDDLGVPVAGAWVSFHQADDFSSVWVDASTDSTGAYTATVGALRQDVMASSFGYTQVGPTVVGTDLSSAPASSHLDLVIHRNDALLKGKVVDANGPVANAGVSVVQLSFFSSAAGTTAYWGLESLTATNGTYSLDTSSGAYSTLGTSLFDSGLYQYRSVTTAAEFDLASRFNVARGQTAMPDLALPTATFGALTCSATACSLPMNGTGWIPASGLAARLSPDVSSTGGVDSADPIKLSNGSFSQTFSFPHPADGAYHVTVDDLLGRTTESAPTVTVGTTLGTSNVVVDAAGYVTSAGLSQVSMLPSPRRLVDTRLTTGPIAQDGNQCIQVAGLNGIPSDAGAVLLNVAAVSYSARGWLTLYPSGKAVPPTSTVNFDPHEYAIANNSIVGLGSDGKVCINAGNAAANAILDATGFVTAAGQSTVKMLDSPQRLVDTRFTTAGILAAGESRCFTATGVAGIPSDAGAALLNVTAVGYSKLGWLTMYPAGVSAPTTTSTVNFDVQEYAIANGAIVNIGTGGQVCVNAGNAPSHVVLDIAGYVTAAGASQVTMLGTPVRLVDTRDTGGPITEGAGKSRCLSVTGVGGIPSSASAVILNVTGVSYTGNGWLTLYPNGVVLPTTSTVNFDMSQYAIANGTTISVGSGGQLCVNVGIVH